MGHYRCEMGGFHEDSLADKIAADRAKAEEEKKERDDIGKALLDLLARRKKNHKGPVDAAGVIARLSKRFSRPEIVSQFWCMANRQQIRISDGWKISLPRRG